MNLYDLDMGKAVPVGDVLLHREAGEAFLLHVPSGRYFGLNQTGTVVWEALVDGTDPTDALQARWPSRPMEQCRSDCAALLASLRAAGLVSDPQP
jgi:hypothetical protein